MKMCDTSISVNVQPMQSQLTETYGMTQCPDNPSAIISECGDSVPCLYDYTTLNAKVHFYLTGLRPQENGLTSRI